MEAVIWFGIAAIIVIALVIAAIGRPPEGPAGTRNTAGRGNRAPSGRRGTRRGTQHHISAGAYGGGSF